CWHCERWTGTITRSCTAETAGDITGNGFAPSERPGCRPADQKEDAWRKVDIFDGCQRRSGGRCISMRSLSLSAEDLCRGRASACSPRSLEGQVVPSSLHHSRCTDVLAQRKQEGRRQWGSFDGTAARSLAIAR